MNIFQSLELRHIRTYQAKRPGRTILDVFYYFVPCLIGYCTTQFPTQRLNIGRDINY